MQMHLACLDRFMDLYNRYNVQSNLLVAHHRGESTELRAVLPMRE